MRSPLTLLASPRLTVVFFVLAAAGSLATAHELHDATVLMALPFALLGLNLGAAILAHARFRADAPLLLFHLALLALALLFVYGRLTYFDGHAILTRGTVFEGHFERQAHGPLHGGHYRDLSFANEGFVELGPQGRYRNTANRVRWEDRESGRWLDAEIGSDRPLILDGYRIYPTRYRGLSPLLAWQAAAAAAPEVGTVQLPPLSAAQEEFPRGIAWYLADGTELWAQIVTEVPTDVLDRQPDLGVDTLAHQLVIRYGDERFTLRPGESIDFRGGRLSYLRLDSWIGYRIVSDPTEPWLAAAIIVAVASLTAFYWRRLRRRIPGEPA